MYCMHCGKILAENAEFCSHCGKKVVVKASGNSASTKNLTAKARSGDTEAISRLYEQTYSKVYYTVRSMIKDEDAIFDIVQDTYVKAFTHMEQFDGSDKFLPWVKQIAANTARDWLKKKRPLLFSEMGDEETDEITLVDQLVDDRAENLPEQVIDQKETARLIREILEELPEDQRAVIGMYYYEELSTRKIAQLMGTTESAVKSRLLYGRRKIEKKVRELEKKGTKLYGLAPILFLLLLFRSEKTYAAERPDARTWDAIQKRMGSRSVGRTASMAGHTGQAASMAGRAGGSLAGSAVVKIGIAAAVAVTLVGSGFFGYKFLNKNTAIPEETIASVQEVVESELDTETDTVSNQSDMEETESEMTAESEEEPPVEAEPERSAFLDVYSELLSKADSYNYDCIGATPTGVYQYALVTLKEGDEIPALLIAQEADDYMLRGRVFLYDAALNQVLQPEEVLFMGVAGVGGYRGDLSTGEGQTQLQLTDVSAGTGAVNVSRILVSGNRLTFESIGSGTLGQKIAGVTYEDIQWFDISDSTGLDNFSATQNQTSEGSKSESKSKSKSAADMDALPTDGNRLVLTGTVERMTYDEAVKLQGCPDPNGSDPKQTWTSIRLDAPQMLEGTQDISTWKSEHSVILTSSSILVKLGIQEDTLSEYVGKHIIFSAGSYTKASDTSVPMGIPWAEDIHVLKVIE